MTNTQRDQRFLVVFNGQPEQRLCVQDDAKYIEWVRGLHRILRHPRPKGRREESERSTEQR